MIRPLKPLYEKNYALYMRAPSGSDQFVSYLDVCIILDQSKTRPSARKIIEKRLEKWAEYPFRANVYKQALADLS